MSLEEKNQPNSKRFRSGESEIMEKKYGAAVNSRNAFVDWDEKKNSDEKYIAFNVDTLLLLIFWLNTSNDAKNEKKHTNSK